MEEDSSLEGLFCSYLFDEFLLEGGTHPEWENYVELLGFLMATGLLKERTIRSYVLEKAFEELKRSGRYGSARQIYLQLSDRFEMSAASIKSILYRADES
jgi:hypothetical protein